jgi:MFS family permease
VIYLPQLVAQAGLPKHWVLWILLADQAIFALADVATGYWVDRVRGGLARYGGWILGATVVSCIAFLGMGYAGAHASLLLLAIVVWAVTSSALRSPPWALLGRYAAKPALPWLSTLVLTGTAIASAAAPYLGIALRGIDPRVPFLVSTLTLLAAVAGLVYAERKLPTTTENNGESPENPTWVFPVFGAFLLLALGFQVHFALNSAPRYLQFSGAGELPFLMPVFWVGFNLLMFPASMLVKRLGAPDLLTVAAALGALGTLATAYAPGMAGCRAVRRRRLLGRGLRRGLQRGGGIRARRPGRALPRRAVRGDGGGDLRAHRRGSGGPSGGAGVQRGAGVGAAGLLAAGGDAAVRGTPSPMSLSPSGVTR